MQVERVVLNALERLGDKSLHLGVTDQPEGLLQLASFGH
jgi:hypothetical protein